MRYFLFASLLALLIPVAAAAQSPGNRLAHLDEFDPYYPSRTFPKLSTPRWVGEDGVEAVVILGIDDMRDTRRYETFLRPILRRLKQIDGRAALSIMTNRIDPQDPQLQTWLKEGVSLETHTYDHPCPFWRSGSFEKARATYDQCVDLLSAVPNSKPVAFRMPCCDSLNTPSPRFWAEIFNKTTTKGNFLTIDTSVFNVFTASDPELPRDLVLNPDGSERFRRYLPTDRTFVNYIEDYPYPYMIGRLCWEFPCVTPSDWSAQHLQKPNNPRTVADWKAALDCTVIKQGVFCLVFHPHGWIKNDQIVELIDHAVTKHGKKVKFLNFREAQERLDKHYLRGRPLRDLKTGRQNSGRSDLTDEKNLFFKGWTVIKNLDLGHRVILLANEKEQTIVLPRIQGDNYRYEKADFTLPPGARLGLPGKDYGLRFIDLDGDGKADVVFSNEKAYGVYLFKDMKTGWSRKVMAGKRSDKDALPMIARNGTNNGFWVHSGHLWWSNEDTPLLKDHVDRRSIKELLKDVQPGPLSPEASLRALKPRPGFTAELMAAEPLVMDPIAFAWGPDGKLWVVEMGDYPLGTDGKGKHGGKIKFLEDTKGTSKYDRATVFLDNLGYPTGVLPWGKGVLVACAPEIFYAEDTDGDGKADKKEVIYTGFTEGNQQHRINGLVYGLDNWIYCANGDSGGRVRSVKTGKVVDIRGRDFRIKPDTGDIDLQSGLTQFGRNRDDWGNWFGGNNSNPMWHFALADHYLRRNKYLTPPDPRVPVSVKPGVAPVYPISRTLTRFNDFFAFNRFTSACSPIVYRDDLFGPAFANNTFVSEPVHNLVHREIMTPRGVTFTSRRAADEEKSEFLASSDNWFRPTMLRTGPDGALWVADMYRHVIEHPQWIPREWQKKLDLRAGHDMGRLYRVAPVGVKPRAIPRLDNLDTAGLVAALDSPNGWQRDMAQMLLIQRKDPAAIPILGKVALGADRPLARLHALCTLDGLGVLRPELLRRALADRHPGVRRHAIRLCEGHFDKVPDLPAALGKLVDDADAQVRLQLAASLGEWADPQAGELLGRLLLKDGSDRYHLAAILSSVNKANSSAIIRAATASGNAVAPTVLAELIRLGRALGNNQGTVALLTFAATPGPNGKYSVTQLQTLAGYLDSLGNMSIAQAGIASLDIAKAMNKVAHVFAFARTTAGDPAAGLEERMAALRLLGRGFDRHEEDRKQLAALLTPQTPEAIQGAAAATLGKLRGADVPALLLRGWKRYPPGLRAQALDALLARADSVKAVLDAVEKKQLLPFEIDAARRQRLLEHKDSAIRDRAGKLLAAGIDKDRQKLIETYRPALTVKGDAVRGLEVFKKMCSACHQLGGVGQEVGPDLAGLRDKSADALLTAILDPNQAVEARYLSYVATTKDGLTFVGLLASEAGNSITLVAADGKKHALLRSDLDDLISTGKSAMPEGLEADVTVPQMADLLAFIRSNTPLPKRKAFEGNRPEVVRPDDNGMLLLTAGNCEIYGPKLVYEKQYGNLGYWSSPDDHAVWTVEVPRAGRYDVRLDHACHPSTAGNTFELRAGKEAVSGKVASTGSWDTYRGVTVGTIRLEPGRQPLVMRSVGPIRGALIDLRSIRLTPAQRQ